MKVSAKMSSALSKGWLKSIETKYITENKKNMKMNQKNSQEKRIQNNKSKIHYI